MECATVERAGLLRLVKEKILKFDAEPDKDFFFRFIFFFGSVSLQQPQSPTFALLAFIRTFRLYKTWVQHTL